VPPSCWTAYARCTGWFTLDIATETGPTVYVPYTCRGSAGKALTKGARRIMTDRALPSQDLTKSIVELLTDTPLVADERELSTPNQRP
jgi:hypothetical protein